MGAGLAAALALVAELLTASPASAEAVDARAPMVEEVPSEATSAGLTAITGSDFNPGLIISDALFFDSRAMTQAQIQSFLQAKVGSCSNSFCLANYRTSSRSKAADAMCAAYSGSSSETAASIIYKVQRACGVSARAILVTLQKEQGLITKSAPTSGAVRIAMGYGCPDTAACDSTYYGFFNQVYQAARQFQRYGRAGTGLTWYPVGQVSNLRYHPNAACGTKAVRIQNRATAALYYYTPYTPNAQALANLTGTGNACSSYGNRNFWRFFNSWFGNSLTGAGNAALTYAHTELGGATGVLGPIVAPVTACGARKSCFQRYENGAVYWMVSTGAFALTGAIWAEFQRQNNGSGTLGYPVGYEVQAPGGSGMPFQTGSIYTSPAGTFAVIKPLRDVYWAAGSTTGTLGWPTGRQTCSGSICAQRFQHGMAFTNGSTGRTLAEDYVGAFDRAGGLAGMGMPVAGRVTIPSTPNGPGAGQSFSKGTIFSSNAGTFGVAGGIKTKYSALRSYLGPLGWPTADQTCTSSGCSQNFQGGRVYYSAALGGRAILSDYLAVFTASDGIETLGLPLGDRVSVSTAKNGPGAGQAFQNGTIYSSAAGAFAVTKPMRDAYWARGSNSGELGWPIAAQTCGATTCTQRFQHGQLSVPKPDANAIYVYWLSTGGANGPLGASTGALVTMPAAENGGGQGQAYANGTVYSSAAGTFAVLKPLRDEYLAHGGYGGPLGWPTSEQGCSAGECTQTFQEGIVFSSTTRGGRAVVGAYADIYDAGRSGLGAPLADRVTIPAGANGGGSGQTFVNGTIYEGAPGAFPVLRPIRDAYTANGGYGGSLGWPTGARECDGNQCVQSFQNGFVFSSPTRGTSVVSGAFAAAFSAAGGLATMGMPLGDRVTVPATVNGGGSGQQFSLGTIYSSPRGTFAVHGAIRSEYWAMGSNSGSLGWPTSAQTCASGECTQTFAGGIIYSSAEHGSRTLKEPFLTAFTAAGGRGTLGVPIDNVIQVTGNPNGNGAGQPFVNGTIYQSAAGIFPVLKPLRDEYWAQGSNSGPLGWPTGFAVCSGGVCTQTFQGGTVTR